MGMSKDELKEMIDNTIFQNGNGQITGNGLNLVLNAIAENAGGNGGGLQTLFFTMDNGGQIDVSFENLDSSLQESILEHNKQIFNSIMTNYFNFYNTVEYVYNDNWGGDIYGNFNFDNFLEYTKNIQYNCCLWDNGNAGLVPFSIICSVVQLEDQGMEVSAVVEEDTNAFENFRIILFDSCDQREYYLYPDGNLEYSSGGPE